MAYPESTTALRSRAESHVLSPAATINQQMPRSLPERLDFIEQRCVPLLREELHRGWKEFHEGPMHADHQGLWALTDMKKFDDDLRERIPNPVYDAGAREMGKHFVSTCARMGLCIPDSFPGSFPKSTEKDGRENNQSRFFRLPIVEGDREIGCFLLGFPHLHGEFGFPSPPLLEFERAPGVGDTIALTQYHAVGLMHAAALEPDPDEMAP